MATDNLYVQKSFVNRTEGYRFGDSDVYESFTDDAGELYRSLQREYGRCEGRVYVDRDGKTTPVGWIFVKLDEYEDTRERYLREVWVTLHDGPPTVTTRHHSHALA